MELCFLFCWNAITNVDLERIKYELVQLQELRQVFIEAGVCADISLPCQHALQHYILSIMHFSSPNGLCSSITESKHIVAVKDPWWWSSRYKALAQMLHTINWLDKLAALNHVFVQQGMMVGMTSAYIVHALSGQLDNEDEDTKDSEDARDAEDVDDVAPVSGPRALSSMVLALHPGM